MFAGRVEALLPAKYCMKLELSLVLLSVFWGLLQNRDGLSLFYFLFVVFIIRIITRSLDRVRENLFSLFCFLFCKISVCRVEETLLGWMEWLKKNIIEILFQYQFYPLSRFYLRRWNVIGNSQTGIVDRYYFGYFYNIFQYIIFYL